MADLGKNFTIRTIVGRMSFDVLETYLHEQSVTIPDEIKVVFEAGKSKAALQMLSDWIELDLISKGRRYKILDDMRIIYLMTRPDVMGNFISTYNNQILETAKTAAQNYTSEYDRAAQFILFCPSICQEWAHIYAIEGLLRRAWVERNTYVPVDLTELTQEQTEAVTSSIKDVLQDQMKREEMAKTIPGNGAIGMLHTIVLAEVRHAEPAPFCTWHIKESWSFNDRDTRNTKASTLGT